MLKIDVLFLLNLTVLVSDCRVRFRRQIFRQRCPNEDLDECDSYIADDMILPKSGLQSSTGELSTRDAILGSQYIWPNSEVPYAIESSIEDQYKTRIKSMIAKFNTFTCIKWRAATEDDEHLVLIAFNSYDPDTCASNVGMQAEQVQIMWLSAKCMTERIIHHEMMHALGFFHEHNRHDRDDFIWIKWENVRPEAKPAFAKLTLGSSVRRVGPYDYGSVMHYTRASFSKNELPTMITKYEYLPGQGKATEMSFKDKWKVNKLYGCSAYADLNSEPPFGPHAKKLTDVEIAIVILSSIAGVSLIAGLIIAAALGKL